MRLNPSQFGAFHWNMLLNIERCLATLVPFKFSDLNTLEGVGYITDRAGVAIPNYNDLSILEDLQGAGLITHYDPDEGLDTLKLTDSGWFVAGILRRMRAEKRDLNEFMYYRGDMPHNAEFDPSSGPVLDGEQIFASELVESDTPDWYKAIDEFLSAFMVRLSDLPDVGKAVVVDEHGSPTYYPYEGGKNKKGAALYRLYDLWEKYLPF